MNILNLDEFSIFMQSEAAFDATFKRYIQCIKYINKISGDALPSRVIWY